MISSKVLIFSICFSLELNTVFVAFSIQKNCQQTVKQPSKTVNNLLIIKEGFSYLTQVRKLVQTGNEFHPGQQIRTESAELPAQDCIY